VLSPDIFEYLIKILLSILLGALIGIERELTHHWAGLRTHILVCLGSTLFMFITSFQYTAPQAGVIINIDATRLAAGVITGIGFLGAGVIFKEGANVKGLTTAASIWVTAAIGLLIGINYYILAVVATLLILAVLYSDRFLEEYVFKEQRFWLLSIILKDKPEMQREIEQVILRKKINIRMKNFKRQAGTISIVYTATIPKSYPQERLTRLLLKNNDVLGVSWER